MATNDLPERQILRSCAACVWGKYFDPSKQGECHLDPANVRATHAYLTCSAHVWRNLAKITTLKIRYGADLDN
jgi:hypothetical protein